MGYSSCLQVMREQWLKQTGHWDWAHQTYWDSFEFFSISICSLLRPEILVLSISGGIQISNSRMFVVAEVNCCSNISRYKHSVEKQHSKHPYFLMHWSWCVCVQMCDIGGIHIETIGGTYTTILVLATASETII